MGGDEDEETRRFLASLDQLKRMFRQPPRQAYDGAEEKPEQVDEEELEAEIDELEAALREDMTD